MQLISMVSIGLLLFYATGVLIYRLWQVNNKPLWGAMDLPACAPLIK
ncbi:hypothetical protein [Desulfobulbus elongatus]|nr:hypothetical protein [Desulfobulbus elongatus]